MAGRSETTLGLKILLNYHRVNLIHGPATPTEAGIYLFIIACWWIFIYPWNRAIKSILSRYNAMAICLCTFSVGCTCTALRLSTVAVAFSETPLHSAHSNFSLHKLDQSPRCRFEFFQPSRQISWSNSWVPTKTPDIQSSTKSSKDSAEFRQISSQSCSNLDIIIL